MQRDQAAGAVKQAQGAVASARSVSDETRLKAPFRGRVVDTLVEDG
jgi:multidrug efflux pump subunit AcrA (membrane-fusion protein)